MDHALHWTFEQERAASGRLRSGLKLRVLIAVYSHGHLGHTGICWVHGTGSVRWDSLSSIGTHDHPNNKKCYDLEIMYSK